MRLKVGAATSTGRVRSINEDAYLANADRGLFVVCDGMGGAAAGEVASGLAIETIAARLNGAGAGEAAGNPASTYLPRTQQLANAIRHANRAIYDRARGNKAQAGMGTTVVGAWIGDGVASVAHVGDSRAYVGHRQTFESVTSDHSLVEAQVQAGLINRDQSLQSEHQNILLRALGRDPDVEVELAEVPVSPGDRLLLCTDGLTRMVTEGEMAAALARFAGEPQRVCEHLVERANANGGPDNITVVVVECQGSRLSEVFGRFTR